MVFALSLNPMKRDPNSHKGENGKVAIIGGSRHMHGAPLLCALAAERSGADLVYLSLPDWHENVAKDTSLNFQVYPFQMDDLQAHDVGPVLGLLATMDCAVLGPGIDHANEDSKKALMQIIEGASCALVSDAAALQPETLKAVKGKSAVLTPHLGELERMEVKEKELEKAAKDSGAVIVLKGPEDQVVGPDGKSETIKGGNAGLTVGGTGDVLAGLIGGLIAQKMDPFEASVLATKIIKKAGEELKKDNSYAYTASDVIGIIPEMLNC
ncbi:TPA: NAD(P)H-hydrate dehydratase [Candidatus Peribacteria bacterium]|nr:NAD(P)H-hydrate dehydratase [Candidatus Peribacteria bacterium]